MSTGDDAASEFRRRIAESSGRPGELARWLDAQTHENRVTAVRGAGRADQRVLYQAVDGFAPVRLSELVPPGARDLAPVRHYGKNTLPAFSSFEKRFCRPSGGDTEKPEELYGFNFQTMAALTGPGYFVARPSPERENEVWVDYNRVPEAGAALPTGWPAVKRNEVGLSRFVYGFMIDTLRRVSEHVTIGSAARKGKDMGSWFLLCREP